MLKQKTMELIEVPYSRLRKLELPIYVNGVIDIVEKHDAETLKINSVFDLLLAEKPNIVKLDVQYRAHPLTKKVSELRKMRTTYVGSILSHLNVVEKEDPSGVDIAVSSVKVEIDRYLRKLSAARTEALKCERVTRFFAAIDSNEELEDAFTSLKFSERLDKLRSVHATILELSKKRVESSSQRPTEKTSDLRDSVILAIRYFFKDLEVAPLRNMDLEYKPLYDELNKLSVDYRNMLSRRYLFDKQKAEKGKGLDTGETVEETETTNSSTAPQPFALRTFQVDTEEMNKNGNGTNNGFGVKPVEQEKAAAKSTKQEQLPSQNNED